MSYNTIFFSKAKSLFNSVSTLFSEISFLNVTLQRICTRINDSYLYGTLLFFAGNSVAVEDIPFAIIGGVVGVFVIVLLALLVVCLLVRRFVIKLWSNTIKKMYSIYTHICWPELSKSFLTFLNMCQCL